MRPSVVASILLVFAAGVHAQTPQPRGGHGAPAQGVHRAPPPTGAHVPRPHRPATVTVTPFPNVATLSGPLPQGLNPPFGPPPRDLFRGAPRPGVTQPYFFPGYAYGGYGDTAPVPPSTLPPPEPPQATGFVRFDVTPGSAQVFVDGLYAGTVDDIENRRGLVLTEGPHRVEFRARGYATESVDVQVPPRDTITYRGALDPERPRAQVPRGPATIYVIPGCYMGNVPPRPERVGPGCDVNNVRVIAPPVQSASASRPR